MSDIPRGREQERLEQDSWCREEAVSALVEESYFSPSYGVFNAVRPAGIGELGIGKSTTSDNGAGLDWRNASSSYDPSDQTTTYSYSGEIEDSGVFDWTDTDFVAGETLDKNGQLVWSYAIYGAPVTQEFQGPDGLPIEIKDVVQVETEKTDSCYLRTTVTTASGDKHKFVTSSTGVPTYYETGPSYFKYRQGFAR